MKMRIQALLLCSCLICFALGSCSRDEVQARQSLEGSWNVVEITSIYGEFSGNGFNPTQTIRETGALGSFDFSASTVDYSFTRNDTLFSGSAPWTLIYEKVNSGFIRVPQFELEIEGKFLFEVSFGDQTKNAEKNATEATFRETPGSGMGVGIELRVEKQ